MALDNCVCVCVCVLSEHVGICCHLALGSPINHYMDG